MRGPQQDGDDASLASISACKCMFHFKFITLLRGKKIGTDEQNNKISTLQMRLDELGNRATSARFTVVPVVARIVVAQKAYVGSEQFEEFYLRWKRSRRR